MKALLTTCIAFIGLLCNAQIGYQVTLLNTATGEPRANETVKISVEITNSIGETVCSETTNSTSNEFGILSITIGDQNTFSNVDWSKLPFFIESKVDGIMIGRSQLLSVPVAEYAKNTGTLTKEILMSKTWSYAGSGWQSKIIFTETLAKVTTPDDDLLTYRYFIDGNIVVLYNADLDDNAEVFIYRNPALYGINSWIFK